MDLFANRLTEDTEVGAFLLNWTGDTSSSGHSVPLRVAGALHALVLSAKDETLKTHYPPNESSDTKLWGAVKNAFEYHRDFILEWLSHAPQTNEIRRIAVMISVSHYLAARFGRPLMVSELGASAGLNLMHDQYGMEVTSEQFGAQDPLLILTPDWKGPLPPNTPFHIIERGGVDLHPLAPSRSEDLMQLMAYTWPDQPERMERLRRAGPAQETKIDKAGADEWLPDRLNLQKRIRFTSSFTLLLASIFQNPCNRHVKLHCSRRARKPPRQSHWPIYLWRQIRKRRVRLCVCGSGRRKR